MIIATRHQSSETTIHIPKSYNYIGAFLTFDCPYKCHYCINRFDSNSFSASRPLPAIEWLRFFEKLDANSIPVTLQGGEPGSHPEFIELVSRLLEMHQVDILSNLTFNLKAFARAIDPDKINRDAPYASIRASYHPSQFSLKSIVDKVLFLTKEGFDVGLYAVEHPDSAEEIKHAYKVCGDAGIDFRTKPFLGRHNNVLHGDFAYPDACDSEVTRECECATSELLIAPDGWIYPCHNHLYGQTNPLEHIAHAQIELSDTYHPCSSYGKCNPCDVKIKNNRFQQFGHTSAKIRFSDPAILP
jgi:MoaA/NifB/PqqE/SkfB family radical SAM enzyme